MMKNKNINLVHNILTPLMLDIEKSSARRRFLRHIKGYKEDFDLEAEEIRKEFSEKNADGSQKVVDRVIQFSKENRKKADVKFNILNDLEIPIDWAGEEKDKEVVKGIIQEQLDTVKKAETMSDQTFEFSEMLEEIISELA